MRKGKIKLDIVYQGVLPYVQIRTTSPSAYPSSSSLRTEENGRVSGDGDGVGEATITQIVHGPGGEHRPGRRSHCVQGRDLARRRAV